VVERYGVREAVQSVKYACGVMLQRKCCVCACAMRSVLRGLPFVHLARCAKKVADGELYAYVRLYTRACCRKVRRRQYVALRKKRRTAFRLCSRHAQQKAINIRCHPRRRGVFACYRKMVPMMAVHANRAALFVPPLCGAG